MITWNCLSGKCDERASELSQRFDADLIVLEECARSNIAETEEYLWFGRNPKKGVGVIARNGFKLERGPVDPAISHSVFPVKVTGPVSFHLLAVWAVREPTYVRAVAGGLDSYSDFLKSAPCVLMGDFNSHSRWDTDDKEMNHSIMVARLSRDFKVCSAYHAMRAGKPEEATLYWQKKESQPYHIDYCFLPMSWVPYIKRPVEIGAFADWTTSDHRPLVVDIAIP
jgi:hypothetical protein